MGLTTISGQQAGGTVGGGGQISGSIVSSQYTGHVDAVGLRKIGWTEDDIQFFQKNVSWNEESDENFRVSDYNISLYENCKKTTYQGVEMADGSCFQNFKSDLGCRFFPKTDTSGLNYAQFTDCKQLIAIPKFNFTATGGSCSRMFYCNYCLISVDLSGVNTDNATSFEYMFYSCYSIRTLDLSNFRTDNVIAMNNMFGGCVGLSELNLTSFNTENVTKFASMFVDCRSLRDLNISNFDTHKATDISSFIYNDYALNSLRIGNNFVFDSVTTQSNFITKGEYYPIQGFPSCSFHVVKSLLTALKNSDNKVTNCVLSFVYGSKIKDDENGTLAGLVAESTSNGYVIYNLTIQEA